MFPLNKDHKPVKQVNHKNRLALEIRLKEIHNSGEINIVNSPIKIDERDERSDLKLSLI